MILIGVLFLAGQLVPGLWGWVGPRSWPLIVVGVGILLLVIGVLTRAPGMIVPACIVGGIGTLLFWQNATGNWESWSYAWALIPGFVGIGVALLGLITADGRTVAGGLWLMVISAVLFAIFASFLGGLNFLGSYWPLLLIGLGVLLLIRSLFGFERGQRRRAAAGTRSGSPEDEDRWRRPDDPDANG
jgi:hypothetical protein